MLVSAHNRDTTSMTVHIQFTLNTLPEGPGVLWNAGGVNVRCADGLTMLSIGESGFITYSTRMDSFKEDCESVSTHDTGLITTGRHTITVRHDGCYATIFVDGEATNTYWSTSLWPLEVARLRPAQLLAVALLDAVRFLRFEKEEEPRPFNVFKSQVLIK